MVVMLAIQAVPSVHISLFENATEPSVTLMHSLYLGQAKKL